MIEGSAGFQEGRRDVIEFGRDSLMKKVLKLKFLLGLSVLFLLIVFFSFSLF